MAVGPDPLDPEFLTIEGREVTRRMVLEIADFYKALGRLSRECSQVAKGLRRFGIELRNPTPLCIDGHEYRRRQRRRVKRR